MFRMRQCHRILMVGFCFKPCTRKKKEDRQVSCYNPASLVLYLQTTAAFGILAAKSYSSSFPSMSCSLKRRYLRLQAARLDIQHGIQCNTKQTWGELCTSLKSKLPLAKNFITRKASTVKDAYSIWCQQTRKYEQMTLQTTNSQGRIAQNSCSLNS
jgi:hypothetical protein